MGRLTKDMTRLCDEIQVLRTDRQELNKKLAEATKARQVEVLETCAAYTDARVWKTESAHNSRQSFVDNLKQVVAEQVKDTRDDLAMARRCWGKHAASMPAPPALIATRESIRGAVKAKTKVERNGRRHSIRHSSRP